MLNPIQLSALGETLRSGRYIDYAANWADNDYAAMEDGEVIEIRVTAKALKDLHKAVESLIGVKSTLVLAEKE